MREFGVGPSPRCSTRTRRAWPQWLNAWAVDFARRTPDCLHTATLFPEPGVEGYVREAIEAGARVFKAHVQVGAYDPNDELLDPVWGLLAEAGIPVVIHCGSGPAPGKHTGPEPVARVLARHPRLRLIVAHMGMPEYADFLDLAERYGEVRLDTTMAFTDFSERFAPFPRAELGPARRPRRPGPAGHRLPEHPVSLRPPAARPGTARAGGRLAAGRVPRERRAALRRSERGRTRQPERSPRPDRRPAS